MYGLRVAWCVFGDVKDFVTRDLFSGSGRRAPHRSSHSVDSVPTVPSSSCLLPARTYKRQSYPTNSASLTSGPSSSSNSSSSRLRRAPSSLLLDINSVDPVHLDDGNDGDSDAVILEHSEDVQLTIDEKVAKWEQEVERRAQDQESCFDDDSSSSSSSSSSYEEEEEDPRSIRHFYHPSSGNEESNEDSVYDDCSEEELEFMSEFDAYSDADSDSDSDSSESAESLDLDDEAEVERDVFSILERTILGTNGNCNGNIHNTHAHTHSNKDKDIVNIEVNVNVDVKVEVDVNGPEVSMGSPPTPWELPFVGLIGGMFLFFTLVSIYLLTFLRFQ